ncbi:hypothetical protein [Clostridium perfringens]|uniref:Uncharacterized protein n=3 Tax=Clostridium TaxID=1485 RepID=A0AAW9J659_CLOPF|nr:hypothetical protein [Clostridium perfringens]MDZ5034002.1 hypothetical protein [Clostridium perfringens]
MMSIVAIGALIICFAVVIGFNYNKKGRFKSKKIVAKMLTSNSLEYAPMEFNGNIYFPSRFKFPEKLKSEPLGTVEPKNMSFFVYLIMDHQIIADKTDSSNTHVKTLGDDSRFYSKAEFLENPNLSNNIFEKYSDFALCEGDEGKETKTQIDKDTLIKLEEKYGEVKYDKDDFNKVDKIYYIYGNYLNTQDAEFIGCILSYENKLYYGNLNNSMEGPLYEKINSILK